MPDTTQLEKEHTFCLRLEAEADAMLAGELGLGTDYQRLAFAFASKSAKSFRGVLRLVESGLGEPALIMARTIFEDLVNLTYVSTNPKELAKLFLEFQALEMKKYIDNWQEAGLEDSEVSELKAKWEAESRAEYERVLPNYPKRTYWSGMNLKEMAASVDPKLAKTYCTLYPYISAFAHGGSPLALASYVGQTDELTLKSLAAPSDAELPEALAAGFGLFTLCLNIFASACHIDESGLETLIEQGESIFGESSPPEPT